MSEPAPPLPGATTMTPSTPGLRVGEAIDLDEIERIINLSREFEQGRDILPTTIQARECAADLIAEVKALRLQLADARRPLGEGVDLDGWEREADAAIAWGEKWNYPPQERGIPSHLKLAVAALRQARGQVEMEVRGWVAGEIALRLDDLASVWANKPSDTEIPRGLAKIIEERSATYFDAARIAREAARLARSGDATKGDG